MPGKPNFIVVLADDVGLSDLGCCVGEASIPSIDARAATVPWGTPYQPGGPAPTAAHPAGCLPEFVKWWP
jgi:hypothetical protein